MVDFPCALHEIAKALVTRKCEVECRAEGCARALRLCERLAECHGVLVQSRGGGGWEPLRANATGVAGSRARLVRDASAARARDGSFAALARSKWWTTPALRHAVDAAPVARTYVVVSYGGCGSKMLAGWLSNMEKQSGGTRVKRVFHFHDNRPPNALREIPAAKQQPSRQNDFRARKFPGGGRFKTDTQPVADLDAYRVLFIFKDPVEALVSRYGHGHCMHLAGDCGAEAAFPKLDRYAKEGRDRMGLLDFFQAYAGPADPQRAFPIVLLNYHKLWDNPDALMDVLGLPRKWGDSFPERTETVRNDLTARAEGNAAHSEDTRAGLERLYAPILQKIKDMPAVSLS